MPVALALSSMLLPLPKTTSEDNSQWSRSRGTLIRHSVNDLQNSPGETHVVPGADESICSFSLVSFVQFTEGH